MSSCHSVVPDCAGLYILLLALFPSPGAFLSCKTTNYTMTMEKIQKWVFTSAGGDICDSSTAK